MTAARPLTPFLVVTFGIALAALLLIALFPLFPGQFNVRVGDIPSRTVTSPRDVTFESTSLTEQKQDEAAASVPAVQEYDASIRDAQVDAFDGVARRSDGARGQARRALDGHRRRPQLLPQALGPRLGARRRRWLHEGSHHRLGHHRRFRDAGLLAKALDLAFSGRLPAAEALAGYQHRRDAAALPMYEITLQMASGEMAAPVPGQPSESTRRQRRERRPRPRLQPRRIAAAHSPGSSTDVSTSRSYAHPPCTRSCHRRTGSGTGSSAVPTT